MTMQTSQRPMIGFVGLSHLGTVSSIAVASKGFQTICYDPDVSLIGDRNSGNLGVFEPGLDELYKQVRGKMRFASDAATLADCDVVYISRDIPTNSQNMSEIGPVLELVDGILDHLKPNAALVLLCQVSPGFTRGLFPIVNSRRKDLHLYYQVETLIFGAALERALKPERYIVGALNPKAPVLAAYKTLLETFECPLLLMRYESAELAKISINMYLVTQVVTTNTIAEVCEQCGADWSEIAPALKLDRRIGPYAYLKAGLGIAGGNLERDLVTFKNLSGTCGTESGLVNAWWRSLDYRREWVLRTLHEEMVGSSSNPVIAVWGLAYKENTHSIKNSQSITLLEALSDFDIRLYDPKAKLEQWKERKKLVNTQECGSAEEALKTADCLIIMTPWAEFSEWSAERIFSSMKGSCVIDPHKVVQPGSVTEMQLGSNTKTVRYRTLGVGAPPSGRLS